MLQVPLTIGIEEEYQIIDPATRALTSYAQQTVNSGRFVLGEQVKYEFMQSQVEVGSHICRNIKEARQELLRLRRTVREAAEEQGCAIAAASTHPFSKWSDQLLTDNERYKSLATEMQDVGRSLLIFGMHVHLGFGTEPEMLDLLIDIQNQFRYFLPHLLALSTSSPFWQGRNTGLKSYRSIVFEAMPRTGIPPSFVSYAEYEQFVAMMGKVGSLGKAQDSDKHGATKIWWDSRPHPDLGTLEIRVADICTTVEEALCIAATIQAIAALLLKLRSRNMSWRTYRSAMIEENKWRAVRYGLDGHLIDFGKTEEVPMRFLAMEMLTLLDEVLDDLDSRAEVEYIKTVLEQGTSADRQLATYRKRLAEGASEEEALFAVVDQLIDETNPAT